MHLALALFTFAFFITIDYVLSRRRKAIAANQAVPATVAMEPVPVALPELEPLWVAGYQLPEDLHYHRGHTWARLQDNGDVTIGLDDFSRRLVGSTDKVKLPQVGAWQRQGERGFEVLADGRQANLLAPLEGEVVAVNREVKKDPALLRSDPYGAGWLYKIRPSNIAANLRNLMSGSLAQRWIEDDKDQLELRLMALSGSVLADGGEPAPDFAKHLDTEDWVDLAEHFLMARARGA